VTLSGLSLGDFFSHLHAGDAEREASRFRSEKGKFKASYESGNNIGERQERQGTGADRALEEQRARIER